MADTQKASEIHDTATVVVSENKRRYMPPTKAVVIILLVVLLVSGVAYGAYAYKHAHPAKPAATPEVVAAKGDYSKAIKTLQQQATQQASDSKAQAATYTRMSQIASTSDKPKDALVYAQKSQTIAPSASAAALVGFAAEQNGNWELAAKAFAQAVAMSPKPADGNQYADYYYYLGAQHDAESHL